MVYMQRFPQSLRKNQVSIVYISINRVKISEEWRFLEPSHDIEMQENMPSSPEKEYGKRSTSLAPAKKFDFGIRMQLAPSPIQEDNLWHLLNKSDFGICLSLSPSPEPQVDIGTRTPSLKHEGLGTSSENRNEFQIIKSYTSITQVCTVWKWGGPAPSIIHSKQPTELNAVEEVEGLSELVCLYISMLQ